MILGFWEHIKSPPLETSDKHEASDRGIFFRTEGFYCRVCSVMISQRIPNRSIRETKQEL